jgi:fructose-1,6-bisphosphatase I
MANPSLTLSRFLDSIGRAQPGLGPKFSTLISQIAFAGKAMARAVARAPLSGQLGLAGDENASGEQQKKLDLITNQMMIEAVAETGAVAAIVSEEMEEPRSIPDAADGFILCTDPLDGSSNTDINGGAGTIFGIYRRKVGASGKVATAELLRRGSEQLAAGFVNYGPSTMMVFTTGRGVNGFTLDSDVGEFILTHPSIKCPRRGKYYSANLGNLPKWNPKIHAFVDYVTASDQASGRPYSLRYAGAFVGDLYRMLISGGIYFYPGDSKNPDGKLRLLYECAPLALLTEQAGGAASDGGRRILELVPAKIHQRSQLAIGSADDVALYEKFLRDGCA